MLVARFFVEAVFSILFRTSVSNGFTNKSTCKRKQIDKRTNKTDAKSFLFLTSGRQSSKVAVSFIFLYN